MNHPLGVRARRRAAALLASLSIVASALALAPAATADESVPVEGATVKADPASPTGYTATFVYHNPDATQVRLGGDLTLLDLATDKTRYQPEAWQTGRYHAGGTEFLRDMTETADGYWSVSLPLHAGALSYWYRVWDPTKGWENKRIWDPASTQPRPPGDASFRVRNNDVLDAVYVPYAEKQNDPVLQARAAYELPMADPAKRGKVKYIPYTTVLGGTGNYLGVYLPPGYDPHRAEPYKVVYLAHGIFGDETDFMVPGSVPNILDNMIAKGEIEPTVAVTMGNHFTGTGLGFATYNQTNAATNLVQNIVPLIERIYNVSREQDGRAYAGFSYGGMTGGVVIKTYPTVFGYYGHFSGNPTLTADDYDDIAAVNGEDDLSVFLGNGVFEGSLDAQNAIAANYRDHGIPAATAQVPGAHDMMTGGQLFTIFARDYLWTRDGSDGGDGLTADQLRDLVSSDVMPATARLAGSKLRLRLGCPAVAAPESCRIALQGLSGAKLSQPATTRTSVSVGAGSSRAAVLRVKPKYLSRYTHAKTMLVKTTVRVGQVQVTVREPVAIVR